MPTVPFQSNPLRDGLNLRLIPDPCSLVIFGATGDLTHRKLVPALYNLAADGTLPQAISVVGFARRDKSSEVFRKELGEAVRKFSRQAVNALETEKHDPSLDLAYRIAVLFGRPVEDIFENPHG